MPPQLNMIGGQVNTITFKKGQCLNCETPLDPGQILCRACTPSTYIKPLPPVSVPIAKMKEGDSGYTEAWAVFEISGQLYILGSPEVSPVKSTYKNTFIRVKNGIFEIDQSTIERDDIWTDWPNMDDNPPYYKAKLVDDFKKDKK